MRAIHQASALSAVLLTCALSGCATAVNSIVISPTVALRGVDLVGLGFNGQTFLLSFEVSNPNSFALPVRSVSYAITLDGQRFATGNTDGEFSVPASGVGQFAISVDLNLLQSAPKLLSIVRHGVSQDVRYELDGRFELDIPLAPTVSYQNVGAIRLRPAPL